MTCYIWKLILIAIKPYYRFLLATYVVNKKWLEYNILARLIFVDSYGI